MNDRIRAVRKASDLNQNDFGSRIGVTAAAISRWESGERAVPETAIRSICREFNVNETWLRTGVGEMRAAPSLEEEMGAEVARLFAGRPDSFKAAVVAALLRFDPDGPEWTVLENIYRSIEAEAKKEE